LRAPRVEIIATTAMTLPQHPPHMMWAASANGLSELASCVAGTMPMIATTATM